EFPKLSRSKQVGCLIPENQVSRGRCRSNNAAGRRSRPRQKSFNADETRSRVRSPIFNGARHSPSHVEIFLSVWGDYPDVVVKISEALVHCTNPVLQFLPGMGNVPIPVVRLSTALAHVHRGPESMFLWKIRCF